VKKTENPPQTSQSHVAKAAPNGVASHLEARPDLSHIAEPLRPLAVLCSSLNFDPDSARLHSDKNTDAIMKSLAELGQDQPLVVQKQGMIVRKGSGRLEAALQ
jgi:hypothetical protein